jgi:hypothetical protein
VRLDEDKVQDPIEDDLQQLNRSYSSSFIILIRFRLKHLCEEHGDAKNEYHDELIPSVFCGVCGPVSKHDEHNQRRDKRAENGLVERRDKEVNFLAELPGLHLSDCEKHCTSYSC